MNQWKQSDVAVLMGGPGAVLWMWLTGVFGIATKYAEALLSVKYRVTNDRGQMSGGPMYVLEKGLNARWAGVLFAIFTAIAAFGIGNMVQSNAIADMIVAKKELLPFAVSDMNLKIGVGILLTVITAAVILGGISSISNFCTILVPFMAGFYILGCLIMLGLNWDKLGGALHLIVTSAFTGQAAVGGFVGAGIADRGDRFDLDGMAQLLQLPDDPLRLRACQQAGTGADADRMLLAHVMRSSVSRS
jgi:AGCS family alanine or glycine:cation symporter